jgi:hypothetical protein
MLDPSPPSKWYDEIPLIPGLICRAFSIELNFKALISQEGSFPKGHKLDKLFNQINESTRKEIIKRSGFSKALFDEKLKAYADTFVKWRYSYEYNNLHCDVRFLTLLSEVVQDLSRNLCQE